MSRLEELTEYIHDAIAEYLREDDDCRTEILVTLRLHLLCTISCPSTIYDQFDQPYCRIHKHYITGDTICPDWGN